MHRRSAGEFLRISLLTARLSPVPVACKSTAWFLLTDYTLVVSAFGLLRVSVHATTFGQDDL